MRGVKAELAALIQQLVDRLDVLGDRYAETVGDLDSEVEALSAKVAEHLAAMGVEVMTSIVTALAIRRYGDRCS